MVRYGGCLSAVFPLFMGAVDALLMWLRGSRQGNLYKVRGVNYGEIGRGLERGWMQEEACGGWLP